MEDILSGSKKLLSESIDLIGESINDVIIVGGWGPYLRHPEKHPGTKDVDILFPSSYSKEAMTEIMRRFLNQGFFISAKHDFQLCRAYQLGNQTYLYNVDLLHATEGKLNKVDFIEIMDLDVTVDGIKVKTVQTINIQNGDLIYSESLFEKIKFEGKEFNVLDASGIVLSKIDSCHNKKRPRDIFDIYLSLTEPNCTQKINQLLQRNARMNCEFKKYTDIITSKWPVYEEHLKSFGIEEPKVEELLLN